MSLITLPTEFKARSVSMRQFVSQRVAASPFGGSEQVTDLLNDRWLMSVELPPLSQADASVIESWIATMRGQSNTVALYHLLRQVPRGTLTVTSGTLAIASASQGASTVTMAAAGLTGTLLPGDLFGAGGLLFEVAYTASVATAAANSITVSITNRVRTALTAATVTLTRPTATFRLLSSSGIKFVPGYAESPSFEFGEAI